MESVSAMYFLKKAKVQILMHPIIFSSLGYLNTCAMISASQTKLIRSLRQKKFRDQHRLYLIEGDKMVKELLEGMLSGDHRLHRLFATVEWIRENESWLQSMDPDVTEATERELEKVSNMVTPQPVLALVNMPDPDQGSAELMENPVLVFESIRDPGNLGTILRTADWFGIRHVVCSPDSADLYNPKVVQATMGAIFRVKVYVREIGQMLAETGMENRRVYGTFLEGESIYQVSLDKNPMILFGNESKGLSEQYDRYIHRKISIPSYFKDGKGPESLNVAASVAVVCSELKRDS
jgi:TrmH family RNA methyltransferase